MSVERLDLEVAAKRVGELLVLVGPQAPHEPVGREHGQAWILQGDEAHQNIAVRPFAADLLRVDARGLVAVVTVGDQQLRIAQRSSEIGDRTGIGDPPQPIDRPVGVGRFVPGRLACRAAPGRFELRQLGSENSEKMGERLALVARVSRRRSSFGPGWVRSCGRIRPAP